MGPAPASFAARAPPLRRSNGPGFSSEKVQVPLVIFVESCHRGLPAVNPQVWDWPANSSLIGHAEFERGELDRRFCLWLDRIRRLHLRKANESLEADAARNRVDGLPLLCQQ